MNTAIIHSTVTKAATTTIPMAQSGGTEESLGFGNTLSTRILSELPAEKRYYLDNYHQELT
jgi:hypothetical protein